MEELYLNDWLENRLWTSFGLLTFLSVSPLFLGRIYFEFCVSCPATLDLNHGLNSKEIYPLDNGDLVPKSIVNKTKIQS